MMKERELFERKMKILVTTDGSDNSMRALAEAKVYGEAMNAEITILHVLERETPRHYSVTGKEIAHLIEKQVESGKKLLADAKDFFTDYDQNIHTLLKKGDPANQILEVIHSTDFNLVIMGNRGLGAFSRTFLGSVSSKVLNHSETNILIVR